MQIRLTVNGRSAMAALFDNPTAGDFASLLPVTVTMYDLFGREKPGPLPRPLGPDGERVFTFEPGDISYWSPTGEVAIFYRSDDSRPVPDPGLVRLGTVTDGLDVISNAGADFTLTIEAVQ
ncbi:cyclophilin-like fold protein [Arthrobacter sp. SAFR-044]|uniref:cyclophilin-like fold protein n=1 Tax=Arthrobacter sp. SAFR-044 TaxID=3387278 RepID=UPI003F7B66C8